MTAAAPGFERFEAAQPRPWWNSPWGFTAAVVVLIAVSIVLTLVRDRRYGTFREETAALSISSGPILDRMALSFDAMLADVYWIRAIQHYGGTKLSKEEDKRYQLLYPLLDITTTLDPRFNIAYRFGAIFLTEAYPNGPGRPDQAVALLQKGIEYMPDKWQYYMDIGFIHYWWLYDYQEAARWFRRGAEVPGSSWWLKSLAATTLAQGGNRNASRMLWQQVYESADNEWMRNEALRRLTQLSALDEIELFHQAIASFTKRFGRRPASWRDLIARRLLTQVPRDPTGHPYILESDGRVTVSPRSPLFPLPAEPPARPSS